MSYYSIHICQTWCFYFKSLHMVLWISHISYRWCSIYKSALPLTIIPSPILLNYCNTRRDNRRQHALFGDIITEAFNLKYKLITKTFSLKIIALDFLYCKLEAQVKMVYLKVLFHWVLNSIIRKKTPFHLIYLMPLQ